MKKLTLPGAKAPWVLVEHGTGECLSDIDPLEAMSLYRQYGALLFRGFSPDIAQFNHFASAYCSASVFNESPDRRLLDPASNIQSVNGGTEAFPLHPELSREPWKPDIAFFFCIKAPKSHGQTTVCDGVALAEVLDREVREGLANRELVYAQPASLEQLEYWLGTSWPTAQQLADPPATCPYQFEVRDGRVWRYFSRPVLHVPMFTGRLAFGNFLLFARYYTGISGFPALDDGSAVPDEWLDHIRKKGDELSFAVAWQNGDVLMLDNSRFMHGRTAIAEPEQRLIATLFGYLKDAPVNKVERGRPWRRTAFRPPSQTRTAE